MLYKIHNPRPATQGIWASGQRVFIKPGATIERDLEPDEAIRAARRVTVTLLDQGPERIAHTEFLEQPDTFAHEFIADINRLQADRVEHQEVEAVNFDTMTDDQLRSYAKSIGLKIHHKAGRAKILEALL